MSLDSDKLRGFEGWTRPHKVAYYNAYRHFYGLFEKAVENPEGLGIPERIVVIDDALRAGSFIPKALWPLLTQAMDYVRNIRSAGFSIEVLEEEIGRLRESLGNESRELSQEMARLRCIKEKLTIEMLKDGGIIEDE